MQTDKILAQAPGKNEVLKIKKDIIAYNKHINDNIKDIYL